MEGNVTSKETYPPILISSVLVHILLCGLFFMKVFYKILFKNEFKVFFKMLLASLIVGSLWANCSMATDNSKSLNNTESAKVSVSSTDNQPVIKPNVLSIDKPTPKTVNQATTQQTVQNANKSTVQTSNQSPNKETVKTSSQSTVKPSKPTKPNKQSQAENNYPVKERVDNQKYLPKEVSVFLYSGDYEIDDQNRIYGFYVNRIDCIVAKLGIKMKPYLVNWTRGQFLLKKGDLDIMASVIRSDFRDSFADFSHSNHTHKYVLVLNPKFHKNLKLPNNYKDILKIFNKKEYSISVLPVSAEESTIREAGFIRLKFASSIEDMVKSVMIGDADALVTELYIIEDYEKKNNVHFKKHFLFEMDCGYYLSKKLTQTYPKFLEYFNKAHQQCLKEE